VATADNMLSGGGISSVVKSSSGSFRLSEATSGESVKLAFRRVSAAAMTSSSAHAQ
jgi:hypothetical protein